jgi:hypothetical protein
MFLSETMALPFYNFQNIQNRLTAILHNKNPQEIRKAFINFCEDMHAILKLLSSLDPKQNNAVKKATTTLNSGKLITLSGGEKKIQIENYIHLYKIKKDFAQTYSIEVETNHQNQLPRLLLNTLLSQLGIMIDFLTAFPEEEDFFKYKAFMNEHTGDSRHIATLRKDKAEFLKTLTSVGGLVYELEHKVNNMYAQSDESAFDKAVIAIFQCRGSTVNYTELAADLLKSKFKKQSIFIIGMTQGSSLLQNQLIFDLLTQLSLVRRFRLPPLSSIDKENLPAEIFNQKEILRNEFNEKITQILSLFKPTYHERISRVTFKPESLEFVTLFANGKVQKNLDKPRKKTSKQTQNIVDVLVIGRDIQKQDLPPTTLTNQTRYALLNDNELFLLYAEIIYLTFWLNSCLKDITQIFYISPSHLFKAAQNKSKVSFEEQFKIANAMFAKQIQLCEKELQRFKPSQPDLKDDKAEAKDEQIDFYANAENKRDLTKIHTALTTTIKPRMEILSRSLTSSTEDDEKNPNSHLEELKSVLQEILSTRSHFDQYLRTKSLSPKTLGKAVSEGYEIKISLQDLRKQYETVAADYALLAQDARWLDRSKTSLEDVNVTIQAANKTISECEAKSGNELNEIDYTNLSNVDNLFNHLRSDMRKADSLITTARESLAVQHTLFQNAEIARQKSLLESSSAFFGGTNPTSQERRSAEKQSTHEAALR